MGNQLSNVFSKSFELMIPLGQTTAALVAPLEEFFEERIPNDEIYLITMFIGAYMPKEKPINLERTIVKAAVVCPNGHNKK
jgi:transcriptional antiterminator